jgi:hypothetical protein
MSRRRSWREPSQPHGFRAGEYSGGTSAALQSCALYLVRKFRQKLLLKIRINASVPPVTNPGDREWRGCAAAAVEDFAGAARTRKFDETAILGKRQLCASQSLEI